MKKRLAVGLSSVLSSLIVAVILINNCMQIYEGTVNGMLGISTSKVVNESDEGVIRYESAYGELNAENLQKLIQDTYDECVAEEEEGAEGTDLQIEDPTGQSQLALHQEEKDLLNMIRDSGKFDKIIVLVNSGWAMELDWLEEYGVDACLWIGLPGQRGFEGVVNLLTGKANPSGRLQDTYAASSTSSPAVVNAGGNRQVWTNLEEVDQNTKDQTGDQSVW